MMYNLFAVFGITLLALAIKPLVWVLLLLLFTLPIFAIVNFILCSIWMYFEMARFADHFMSEYIKNSKNETPK